MLREREEWGKRKGKKKKRKGGERCVGEEKQKDAYDSEKQKKQEKKTF